MRKTFAVAAVAVEEIAEAVTHAGYVRHWSAVLNGLQIDFETLKADFSGD